MTLTDKIESSTHSLNRHGAAGHPNEAGNREQDEKPFPFLKLPAEIRNAIYRDLLTWHHSERGGSRLHEQPAITRVSRQLRAEALPLYYASSIILQAKADSPEEWVSLIQSIVDDFAGGPGRPPGSSTLRLLGGIQLDFFRTRHEIHIKVALASDPDDLKVRAPGHPYG